MSDIKKTSANTEEYKLPLDLQSTKRIKLKEPDPASRMFYEKITALVSTYMWNWRHMEGCFPLGPNGCICGLESVKSIILETGWGFPKKEV